MATTRIYKELRGQQLDSNNGNHGLPGLWITSQQTRFTTSLPIPSILRQEFAMSHWEGGRDGGVLWRNSQRKVCLPVPVIYIRGTQTGKITNLELINF